jgi:hypothetical protein
VGWFRRLRKGVQLLGAGELQRLRDRALYAITGLLFIGGNSVGQ